MRDTLRDTLKKIALEDILAIIGLGFLSIGLWIFRPWVALSVVGILLIAASILRVR